MMKIDPHLSTRYLRSILVGCVPLDTDISSDYIGLFRKRCQIYYVTNPEAHLLNGQQASTLTSATRLSIKKLDVLEDPDVIKNFCGIYENIMQSGTNIWKALACLKK